MLLPQRELRHVEWRGTSRAINSKSNVGLGRRRLRRAVLAEGPVRLGDRDTAIQQEWLHARQWRNDSRAKAAHLTAIGMSGGGIPRHVARPSVKRNNVRVRGRTRKGRALRRVRHAERRMPSLDMHELGLRQDQGNLQHCDGDPAMSRQKPHAHLCVNGQYMLFANSRQPRMKQASSATGRSRTLLSTRRAHGS